MLDIKSKNNKKLSLLLAAALVCLAAGVFLVQYPIFKKNAQAYENQNQNSLQGDDFLNMLYQCNYVLYRDITDKVDETTHSYPDLYLEMSESAVSQEEMSNIVNSEEEDLVDFPQDENAAAYTDAVKTDIASRMESWETEVQNGVFPELDYCVIDDRTGQYIKNTGRNIEALNQKSDSAKRQELPYVYYVKMSFDGAGNVQNVGVKDTAADELLKSVQRIMKSRLFESQLNYINANYDGSDSYYGYTGSDNKMSKVSYRIKGPQNTTFIYALTKEQKESITGKPWGENGALDTAWSVRYAYYNSGAMDAFMGFLLLLLLAGILLPVSKKYTLKEYKIMNIPLEISVIGAVILISAGSEVAISLVSYTNLGYFKSYLSFLPEEIYPAAIVLINFVLLVLFFGAWFYCVSTWGAVFSLGIKEFLKKRSLLVRLWLCFYHFCRRKAIYFKEEFLHVDLKENAGKMIAKAVAINFLVLAIMCSMWFFGWIALIIYSVVLFFLLKKYIFRIQEQYRRLLEATGAIADGNFNTTFEEDLGVFESYKKELYKIQEGFRTAVDEEVKSQRMKAELITNVSHDLKTPLTAITTYIDLLKEKNITEEQRQEYIAVLEKKSLRLKSLIEDLFEVSKANSKNVTMNPVDVDICNLMRQVYLEYEDRVEEADLTFRFRVPEEKVIIELDSQKTYRIFENLYTNIIKYAMPHTRVYVNAEKTEEGIRIELKNMSAEELCMSPDELTERFVRGDSSRNTEGNGLGLAIAKSFTELQGGTMDVEIDGDLFKVTLEW